MSRFPEIPEPILPLRTGSKFICELPGPLGFVKSMKVVNGRVVCKTESGIDFLVPTDAEKA